MILKEEHTQEPAQIEAEISKPKWTYRQDPRKRGQKLYKWNPKNGDVLEVPEDDFIFSADVAQRLVPIIDDGKAHVAIKKQMKSTKLVRVEDGFGYCVAINLSNATRKFTQRAVEAVLRRAIKQKAQ